MVEVCRGRELGQGDPKSRERLFKACSRITNPGQYQACLHLLECISHGDFKYGNSSMLRFVDKFGSVVCIRLMCGKC